MLSLKVMMFTEVENWWQMGIDFWLVRWVYPLTPALSRRERGKPAQNRQIGTIGSLSLRERVRVRAYFSSNAPCFTRAESTPIKTLNLPGSASYFML